MIPIPDLYAIASRRHGNHLPVTGGSSYLTRVGGTAAAGDTPAGRWKILRGHQ
jgi:hypothetical protein